MKATKNIATQKHIFFSDHGHLYSVTNDSDGNIWACGYTYTKNNYKPCFLTIDKDTKKVIAQKCVLPSKEGYLYSILKDSNDTLLAFGCIYENTSYNPFFITIDKTTKEIISQKRIITPNIGCLNSIMKDSNGNIWSCGFIDDSSLTNPFFIIIDKNTKEVIMQKRILTSENVCLQSITEDSNGNIWGCGYTLNGFRGKPIVVSIDKDTMEITMQKYINDNKEGYLYSIIEGFDGNIWACGEIDNGSCTSPFFITIDKNTQEVIMQKCIFTSKRGYLRSIIKDSEGNIWMCGNVCESSGVTPIFIIIDKATKEIIIKKCFLHLACDWFLYSIIITSNNNIWACGFVNFGSYDKPFLINMVLSDIQDPCSYIIDANYEITEIDYTVEDTSYSTKNTNYQIKSTSYSVEECCKRSIIYKGSNLYGS